MASDPDGVEATALQAAWKVRRFLKQMVTENRMSDHTLGGWCCDATMLIYTCLGEGTIMESKVPVTHVWLFYHGYIVDVTATQFGDEPPVVVRKWTEDVPWYWQKTPMVSDEMKTLWASANRYANREAERLGIEKPDWLLPPQCPHGIKDEEDLQCPECPAPRF